MKRWLGIDFSGNLDVAAEFLFEGKRPQHYDPRAVSAPLSAKAGDSR